MKVTFFFTSTKVGFQLPNIGYVSVARQKVWYVVYGFLKATTQLMYKTTKNYFGSTLYTLKLELSNSGLQ